MKENIDHSIKTNPTSLEGLKVTINETKEIDDVKFSFVISNETENGKTIGRLYLMSPKYIEKINTVSNDRFKFGKCKVIEMSAGNVEKEIAYTIEFKELLVFQDQ